MCESTPAGHMPWFDDLTLVAEGVRDFLAG
jgi:hypothetical protein